MMTATPGVMTLTIPAAPEHVRFARLLAGGLATQCQFDVDAVEDVRIAVDECCHALIGDRVGIGTITLTCGAVGDGVRIEGWGDAELSEGATPEFAELSEAILEAVADEYALLERDGLIGFVVTKRNSNG
jgi:hypothetical protein